MTPTRDWKDLRLGVVDYWTKDMSVADLRERIDRVLLADQDTA